MYTPSLQNYPDLPPWIHYKFNNKNRHGYLYGTPPVDSLERQIQVTTNLQYWPKHSVNQFSKTIFIYFFLHALNIHINISITFLDGKN